MSWIIDLDKELSFGKYFGRKVKDIIKEDPEYIKWMISNRKSFLVGKDVLDEIEKLEKK